MERNIFLKCFDDRFVFAEVRQKSSSDFDMELASNKYIFHVKDICELKEYAEKYEWTEVIKPDSMEQVMGILVPDGFINYLGFKCAISDDGLIIETLSKLNDNDDLVEFRKIYNIIKKKKAYQRRIENGYVPFRNNQTINLDKCKYEDIFVKLCKPDVSASTGYNKRVVFDFIEVEVLMSQLLPKEKRIEAIKKYKAKLIDNILKHLKEYPGYSKYGVPVNYLKVDKITLLKSGTITVLLSLKQIEEIQND